MGQVQAFRRHLTLAEYAEGTIDKYCRDIALLLEYLDEQTLDKESLITYKKTLEDSLSPSSVNRKIAAINCFLHFCGLEHLALKALKIQLSSSSERELTRREFQRLVQCAYDLGKQRMALVMLTLGGTGIRIGELHFITVKAAKTGKAVIRSKGKTRTVILTRQLQDILLDYCRSTDIGTGSIFIGKTGRPLSRPYISMELKKIADACQVTRDKVFPHNFRHFFARRFLDCGQPITDLADHLGHVSINTTRRYLLTSTATRQRQLAKIPIFPTFPQPSPGLG